MPIQDLLPSRNYTPSGDPDLHPLAHQEPRFAELLLEHLGQAYADSIGNSLEARHIG